MGSSLGSSRSLAAGSRLGRPKGEHRVALVAALVVLSLAFLWTRAVLESRRELHRAQQLDPLRSSSGGAPNPSSSAPMSEGSPNDSAFGYKRAASWYVPFNPYVPIALESLRRLAMVAEHRAERALALEHWRAIRAAILSTRSVWIPHRDRLSQANEHIASLLAEAYPPGTVSLHRGPENSNRPLTRSEALVHYQAQLDQHSQPIHPASFLPWIGFSLILGSALHLRRRGYDEENRPLGKRRGTWATMALGMCVALAAYLI